MARLGIAIQETWNFFEDIYNDLSKNFQTSLFIRRTWPVPVFRSKINHYLYDHDLRQFLKSNDVVLFEWASELLAKATHMPKACGIVTRLHRYEMYEWVNRIEWKAVDKIIVVSQAKKREFITRFPWCEDKVVVCGVGVSLDKFFPKQRVFNGDIGILCNLIPRKRVYELILSFYELNKIRKDLHLHIGGGMDPANEDYYYALMYLVKELDLSSRVSFCGNVTDTRNWFQNIDVFISNSYSEGLQVAPMEAMASGCYCLSHHWDGSDELLPPENLYFTNSELRQKILHYCDFTVEEKELQRSKMREIACAKFDNNQTKIQIRQVLTEVLYGL
jgi:glycosyltransferase involved in cell wall biosynthesis